MLWSDVLGLLLLCLVPDYTATQPQKRSKGAAADPYADISVITGGNFFNMYGMPSTGTTPLHQSQSASQSHGGHGLPQGTAQVRWHSPLSTLTPAVLLQTVSVSLF